MRTPDETCRLPEAWVPQFDALELMQSGLNQTLESTREKWGEHEVMGPLLVLPRWRDRIDRIALLRPKLTEEQIRWWVHARRLFLALPGMRGRLFHHRQELHRQWAREIVARYFGTPP